MIQIIGLKSCRDTAASIRYLKERRKEYQFVDLSQRKLSDGELDNIFSRVSAEDCIDTTGKFYKSHGYAYMEYDAEEELREHNELFRTPILRSKGRVAIGFDKVFLEENA